MRKVLITDVFYLFHLYEGGFLFLNIVETKGRKVIFWIAFYMDIDARTSPFLV